MQKKKKNRTTAIAVAAAQPPPTPTKTTTKLCQNTDSILLICIMSDKATNCLNNIRKCCNMVKYHTLFSILKSSHSWAAHAPNARVSSTIIFFSFPFFYFLFLIFRFLWKIHNNLSINWHEPYKRYTIFYTSKIFNVCRLIFISSL